MEPEPYVELTFRVETGLEEKLLEQIEAYNAFVTMTSQAEGPSAAWLKRLT